MLPFQLPRAALEVQLLVRPLVGWLVGWDGFVKKLPLEYQIVTYTYLPSYLWDRSDGSDSSDSSDISDSNDISDRP